MRNPGMNLVLDSDSALAEASRRKMFERAIAEKAVLTGYHWGPRRGHDRQGRRGLCTRACRLNGTARTRAAVKDPLPYNRVEYT
jgi:hypothetical protein